jgi:hypothetical protein
MRSFLAIIAVALPLAAFAAAPPKPGALPVASDADAWKVLPRKNPPLPVWARTLAGPLPKTTAAMLDLDRLHRAEHPLGPVLSAKLRWLAADAIGCEYARKYAEFDLKQAKVPSADIKTFVKGTDKPTEDEARLFKLTRKLAKAAYTVTDEEFAAVLKAYGPDKACAVVHTAAYCGFFHRILFAVGAEVEEGGPLPPLPAPLSTDPRGPAATPARAEWATLKDAKQPKVTTDSPWPEALDFQAEVATQKERKGRMPLPPKERLENLSADSKRMAESILWNTVSAGYQPAMTDAWFVCLRAYQAEAQPDKQAWYSLFWVVTRGNECFY